jgi:hypothetical protein
MIFVKSDRDLRNTRNHSTNTENEWENLVELRSGGRILINSRARMRM